MPKLVFKAELRLPRMVILPMSVAREADVPRTLTISEHSLSADKAIVEYLQGRYPTWMEKPTKKAKADSKPAEDAKPTVTDEVESDASAAEATDSGESSGDAEPSTSVD